MRILAYLINCLIFPPIILFGIAASQADYSPARQTEALVWSFGVSVIVLVNVIALTFTDTILSSLLRRIAYGLNASLVVLSGFLWLVPVFGHGDWAPFVFLVSIPIAVITGTTLNGVKLSS
jgi:hypothetical protein